jgi:hypothetical protein
MRMLAAVIFCFLIAAPALAHQQPQQDERAKQQDEKAKQQNEKVKQQNEKAGQRQEKTKQQQERAPQEERARTKTEQKQQQQKETAKRQQQQQKQTAKQQEERAKQEQKQAKQESKARQEQQRTYAKRQEQEQQNAEGQRVRQEQQGTEHGGHAFATAATYHAAQIHPRHGGRVIPDRAYADHFGPDHHFHAQWRHAADRFRYGGYWFVYSEPWPAVWAENDNYFIVYDYDDDDYYLCDLEHPEFELLIVVQS